jgi:hypothetical protein
MSRAKTATFSARGCSGRVAIEICLESSDSNIEWNEPGGGNAPQRVAAFRERHQLKF